MTATRLSDVTNQVKEYWSDMFMDEVIEATPIANLLNKEYEGEIKKGGDTVYVSQIQRPDGQIKQIGTDPDYDTFNSEKLTTVRDAIIADRVISASFEFDDIVYLQSQIGDQDSAIRRALMESVSLKLNSLIYSQVSPSASSPDHVIDGVSDFDTTQLLSLRKLAAQAKWPQDRGGKWLLLGPQYYSDLLDETAMSSGDYIGPETPIVNGIIARQRAGFNILEDNSDGMFQLSPTADTSGDTALAFHPDFMALVMQKEPEFKIAELTANKQFGFVIVVRMVVGVKQLTNTGGDEKVIKVYNS